MNKITLLLISLSFLLLNSVSAQSESSYQLSTHILDINQGKPASGVPIVLFKLNATSNNFEKIASGRTDENGRIADFLPSNKNNEGIYKLKFETKSYFTNQNIKSIYPYTEVVFEIEGNGHYHIPIIVSANGYSTYRGN